MKENTLSFCDQILAIENKNIDVNKPPNEKSRSISASDGIITLNFLYKFFTTGKACN